MKPEQQILELHLRGEFEAAQDMIQAAPDLAAQLAEGQTYLQIIDYLQRMNSPIHHTSHGRGLSIEMQIIELDLRGEFEAASELISATPYLVQIKERDNLSDAELIGRLRGLSA